MKKNVKGIKQEIVCEKGVCKDISYPSCTDKHTTIKDIIECEYIESVKPKTW